MLSTSAGRLLAGVTVLCTLVAFVLTSPLSFGLSSRGMLQGEEKGEGFGWQAVLPEGVSPPIKRVVFFPPEYRILEDGVLLDGTYSQQKAIERGGWGRSRLQGAKVFFSTSDRGTPGERKYEIVTASLQVPEIILALFWAVVVALWVGLLRQCRAGEWRIFRGDVTAVSLGIAGVAFLLSGMMLVHSWADEFLLRLGVPVLWAVAFGLLATGRRGLSIWFLGLLALIPAVATYVYYVVNEASHGSFLVASVLPMSDAWLHFKQASQIALQGVTQVPFNGRLLYPAYFSSFLWLADWNLSLANAYAAGLVLLLLALACWVWRPQLGVAGTALFALLCWLYFREFGSGLVMTEVLGLTCGLLGVVCLFLGCEQRRIPIFLLGVFWMSMASSARPGALFALPLLGLSGGWLAWSWAKEKGVAWSWKSLLKPIGIVALAALLVIIPFALNQQMTKTLYAGKVEAFGNFSYTLNGLLTGTTWVKSYEEMDGNVEAIMAENVRLMKTEPWRITAGIGRAYQKAFDRFFLFSFGPERRLAESMKWLCLLGLLAFWLVPNLRPHAPWIWAGALGVILSIPFAPPWDAEMRPYAATVPLQCLIPAAGLAGVLYFLRRRAGFSTGETSSAGDLARRLSVGVSVGLVIMIVVWPLGRSFALRKVDPSPAVVGPIFHPGSFVVVGGSAHGETYEDFQKRLAAFAIGRGEADAREFYEMPPGLKIGIDWSDLEVIRILPDSPVDNLKSR